MLMWPFETPIGIPGGPPDRIHEGIPNWIPLVTLHGIPRRTSVERLRGTLDEIPRKTFDRIPERITGGILKALLMNLLKVLLIKSLKELLM